MLTQPLPHFEFKIHGRSTLLVPIDEQVWLDAGPPLIVKPGSIEGRAQSRVIHVVSTRIPSHRRDVLEGRKYNRVKVRHRDRHDNPWTDLILSPTEIWAAGRGENDIASCQESKSRSSQHLPPSLMLKSPNPVIDVLPDVCGSNHKNGRSVRTTNFSPSGISTRATLSS